MKCKFLIITVFFIAFAFLAKAENTRVSGNIYNYTTDNISIKYNSNKPNGKQEIINGKVVDGVFEINFNLYDYVEAFLYSGRNKVCKFYLEPNENLEINVDLNDISNSLYFRGDKSAKDNFWVSFSLLYPEFNRKAFYYKPFSFFTTKDNVSSHLSNKNESAYMQFVENKYNSYFDALNNFLASYPIDEGSLANIKSIFEARKLNDIVTFYYLEQSYLRKEAKLPIELEVNIKNLNSYGVEQLNNQEYVNLNKNYLAYLFLVNQSQSAGESSYDQYKLISSNFDGPVKYYMQTLLITKDLANKDIQLWEIVNHQFKSENPYIEWNEACDKMYNKILMKSASVTNASFYLPNKNNTYKHSSDYLGKVVYISFWASWCKPCLTNFDKYADKKNALENRGVVFVNINVDEDIDKAYNALAKYDIKGINLFAKEKIDDISAQFNVSSLPAYFLIDQNGKLTPYTGNLGTVARDIENLLY